MLDRSVTKSKGFQRIEGEETTAEDLTKPSLPHNEEKCYQLE